MNDIDFAVLADENTRTFTGAADRAAALRSLIAANDIVFGLYPDRATGSGWDKHLIKGSGVLTLIAAGNKKFSAHHKVTAVWCDGIEDAMAMERSYGDDRG